MAKDHPHIVVKKRKKERSIPVPRAGFKHVTRGRLTLVTPHEQAKWDKNALFFRSLIYDRDSRVVSTGLPKFFETHQTNTQAADEAIRAGEAKLFVKYDGILMIRSVVRGEVWMRTRGSFDGEHHEEAFRRIAGEKYPRLLDADFMPHSSLHFEYVSPKHQIVLSYPEEDLIFLGGTDNATLLRLAPDEVEQAVQEAALTQAEQIPFSENSVQELQERADRDSGREGYVLVWDGGLLKVKGRAYKEATRARYELNPKKLHRIIKEKKIIDAASLIKKLKLSESDPLVPYVERVFATHQRWEEEVESEIKRLKQLVEDNSTLSRKLFTRRIAAPEGTPAHQALLKLRTGDEEAARELIATHKARDLFSTQRD